LLGYKLFLFSSFIIFLLGFFFSSNFGHFMMLLL